MSTQQFFTAFCGIINQKKLAGLILNYQLNLKRITLTDWKSYGDNFYRKTKHLVLEKYLHVENPLYEFVYNR